MILCFTINRSSYNPNSTGLASLSMFPYLDYFYLTFFHILSIIHSFLLALQPLSYFFPYNNYSITVVWYILLLSFSCSLLLTSEPVTSPPSLGAKSPRFLPSLRTTHSKLFLKLGTVINCLNTYSKTTQGVIRITCSANSYISMTEVVIVILWHSRMWNHNHLLPKSSVFQLSTVNTLDGYI